MLKLVDQNFERPEPQSSLLEITREVRSAAEHLSKAYNLLENADLQDRAKLQLAVFDAASKMGLIVAAIAGEIAANSAKRPAQK